MQAVYKYAKVNECVYICGYVVQVCMCIYE